MSRGCLRLREYMEKVVKAAEAQRLELCKGNNHFDEGGAARRLPEERKPSTSGARALMLKKRSLLLIFQIFLSDIRRYDIQQLRNYYNIIHLLFHQVELTHYTS